MNSLPLSVFSTRLAEHATYMFVDAVAGSCPRSAYSCAVMVVIVVVLVATRHELSDLSMLLL